MSTDVLPIVVTSGHPLFERLYHAFPVESTMHSGDDGNVRDATYRIPSDTMKDVYWIIRTSYARPPWIDRGTYVIHSVTQERQHNEHSTT